MHRRPEDESQGTRENKTRLTRDLKNRIGDDDGGEYDRNGIKKAMRREAKTNQMSVLALGGC
jgi:hypothetical protein